MKSVKLYYNPTAGEGANLKKELIARIRKAGYGFVNAIHKKDGMGRVETEADILAVAGGDGTVRKVCLELLNMPLKNSRPIGLLAVGTANNIARTLHIGEDVTAVIGSWDKHYLKRFDVGRVEGLGKPSFFVESFGCGIFPRLMKKLSGLPPEEKDSPDKEFAIALKTLLKITRRYKAVYCRIEIDGKDHSGEYILAELLNIRSLGPKLVLAPDADPGDGHFDIILIKERHREQLLTYIEKISKGINARFPFKTIKGKNIELQWEGKNLHIDDELITKYKPAPLRIKLLDGMLDFLVDKQPG